MEGWIGSSWRHGSMSWELNVKPYLGNDKWTKLSHNENLIQIKDSYLGMHEKENPMHLIYSGCEFLIYA